MDWTQNQFVEPERRIITEDDLLTFKNTQVIQEILKFIGSLCESVQSKPISATPIENPKFEILCTNIGLTLEKFLLQLEQLLQEVEPIQQNQRFGNKAFREWLKRADPLMLEYLKEQLPDHLHPAIIELHAYLRESFGNQSRIDYGTGHEFNFILFLLCLNKLGLLQDDYEGIVRLGFYKYLDLVRKIQLRYMLEPAGSHGVWGLDDYQFLPFLFGASELIKNKNHLLPEVIVKETIIKKYKADYQFFQCIDFIDQVKKGPFNEHSPILYSLTNIPHWEKVTQGLSKMFQGELLFKHPVIKHTLFGSLIAFK